MKQSLIFAFLALIAFACDFNDMPEPRDETQKWALAGYQVEVSGDLEYTNIQDSAYVYSLLPDGSFSKKVGEYELKGTYEESFSDGLKRYKFMYTSKNSLLIHSCATSSEDYFINSKGQLTGTWDACDGPKLYFNKQK
ncbi:hypothetical protein V8V91_16475 [Algoriphagus halophilus]|uniref:hypothetical protein n=1 Tax=Algoriphagus halophilus TaxID=226505 RepID=UPI00358E695C